LFGRGSWRAILFEGRNRGGNEEDPVEIELLHGRLSEHKMPQMYGVKGATENPDTLDMTGDFLGSHGV
jgi:hypothetical protein